ncbi:MAG: alkaline phosphatase family protein [Polyangiaceae bacterium]
MRMHVTSALVVLSLLGICAAPLACGGSDATAPGGGGVDADGGVTNDDGGGNTSSDGGTTGGDGGTGGGTLFPPGTVCNSSGSPLTPPATLKHLIVILLENENYNSVNGSAKKAPYINSLASQCGVATAYNDDCFGDNLVSLPHYLALTSGSNCNTGLDRTGSGCITDDNDATDHTLTTTSIFDQVPSWKSYQEDMPSACDTSTNNDYATKHNPPAYYSNLAHCVDNDVGIATVDCNTSTTMTACTPAPSNAFTQDLANDTLAAFSFVTPDLQNDMHDGTITQADNWLFTYVPLILQSKAYLRGEVALQLLWDEQSTASFGSATPNVFISPYIKAGASTSTAMNHFAMLRAWENAFGISTYLGCASGTPPGGSGTCPADSTADVRAALGW